MKIKKILLLMLVLLMVQALFLTACKKEEEPDTPEEDNTEETVCTHEDTEIRNAKAATCTEEGYTGDKYCKKCGEKLETGKAIPVTGHIYDKGVVSKEPTCQAEGEKLYTCTVCGATKTEVIPKLEHNHIYTDNKDGTHHHSCHDCMEINKDEPHTPINPEGTYHEATCEEGAYKEFECKDCGAKYRIAIAEEPALGHRYSEWAVEREATCTQQGISEHHCTREGCNHKETVTVPQNPANHKHVTISRQEPTCQKVGYIYHKCSDCGAIIKTEVIPTVPHQYDEGVADGSGYVKKTCKVCHETVTIYDAKTKVSAEVGTATLPESNYFEVGLQNADIRLPQEVVQQIKAKNGTNVKIEAEVLDEATKNGVVGKLTEEQKKAIGDGNIYNFGVLVDNTSITQGESKFDKKVKVTIPYTLKEGETADGIVIWYVKDDGTVTSVPAVYNPDTKTVTFETDHFSYYAIVYEETDEMRCQRGQHVWELDETLSQDATCEHEGYSVYKCKHCLAIKIFDYKDRLPHEFSEEIYQPEVDCTHGGYTYRVCKHCGAHKNIEYIRAEGHKITSHATCTEPAICEKCHQIVEPARGHNFSDWEIIKNPTETEPGLRRRHCKVCGEVQETTIDLDQTDVKPLDWTKYEDIIEDILAYTYSNSNGKIKLQLTMPQSEYKEIILTLTAKRDGDKYIGYFNYALVNKYDVKEEMTVIYRKGRIYEVSPYSAATSDILSLVSVKLEAVYDALEKAFNQVNPQVELAFAQLKELIKSVEPERVDAINALLKKWGLTYTYDDLNKLVNKFETIYAYMAAKLNFKTSIPMHGTLNGFTEEEVLAFFKDLVVKETLDGKTVYKFDITPLLTEFDNLLKWFENHKDKTLSDILFELYGKEIAEKCEGAKNTQELLAFINKKLPGDTKLKVFVDKMITYIEETKVITVDELYNAINKAAISTGKVPQDFDIRTVIEQYQDLTLDAIVQQQMGPDATFAMLTQQLISILDTTTLYAIPVPPQFNLPLQNLGEVITQLQGLRANTVITLKGELTKAPDGRFVLGNLIFDFSAKASETETVSIIRFNCDYALDGTVEIKIPEIFDEVPEEPVITENDKGDLIIDFGKDVAMDYLLFTGPESFEINIEEALVKNLILSKKFGYDVFEVKPQYTYKEDIPVRVIKVGEKYYAADNYTYEIFKVKEYVNLQEAMRNCERYLPTATDNPIGYYTDINGQTGYMYRNIFGYVYQSNGIWYIIGSRDNGPIVEDSHGNRYFENVNGVEYINTLKNGEIIEVSNNYFGFEECFVDDEKTLFTGTMIKSGEVGFKLYGTFTKRDQVCLATNCERVMFTNHISEEVPAEEVHTYEELLGNSLLSRQKEYIHFYENGKLMCYEVMYKIEQKFNTRYFVKLGDRYFQTVYKVDEYNQTEVLEVEGLSTYIPNELEVKTLPDGTTLHVVNYLQTSSGNQIYDIVYGFINIEKGHYVQCAVLYDMNGEYVETIYRNGGNKSDSTIFVPSSCIVNKDIIHSQGNGKYIIYSEDFKAVKNIMAGKYGSVNIIVRTGDVLSSYSIYNPTTGDDYLNNLTAGGASTSMGIDWYSGFELNNGHGIIVKKDDGSIDIIKNHFENEINISVNGKFDSSILHLREDISRDCGFDVYEENILDRYAQTLVAVDGKYYNYRETINSTYHINSSSKDPFDLIDVQDIRLRLRGSTENGLPIYECDFDNNRIYIQIGTDNKILVLLDVIDRENMIEYSSSVTYEEFIKNLKPTNANISLENNTHLDIAGGVKDVYSESYTVQYGGYKLSFSFDFYKNDQGEKIYFEGTYSHRIYLELLEEVNISNEDVIERITVHCYENGAFKFAEISRSNKIFLSKLGDSLFEVKVDLTESGKYKVYGVGIDNKEYVLDLLCDRKFVYYVKDEVTGAFLEVTLQESGINGYKFAYTGIEIDAKTIYQERVEFDIAYVNGVQKTVYRGVVYVENYESGKLPDGHAFIRRQGSDDMFVELSNDIYLEIFAYRENANGTFEYNCSNHVNYKQLLSIRRLEDKVNVKANCGVYDYINITKELVDYMKQNPDIGVEITIKGVDVIFINAQFIKDLESGNLKPNIKK